MKPHIYRPGDRVRIVNPKFVRRVGYPLVWHEVSDEQLYADPRICGALRALGLLSGTKAKGDLFSGADEIPRHLQIAFAKEFVAQNRFGGNARTIHYYGDDQPPAIVFDTAMWNAYYGAGTVHTVISRRHVKTGT